MLPARHARSLDPGQGRGRELPLKARTHTATNRQEPPGRRFAGAEKQEQKKERLSGPNRSHGSAEAPRACGVVKVQTGTGLCVLLTGQDVPPATVIRGRPPCQPDPGTRITTTVASFRSWRGLLLSVAGEPTRPP